MDFEKVKAAGIEFAYRWDGNPDGPVVMMAHAMGTSHRIWDWQVPALEDRYRLLRYDWRGHGDTGAPPGPYTLSQFVSDAVAVMDALDLRTVHWVGISTGGMIGQGLGIHHPERIASLTLCNTTSQSTAWYREWVKERQAVVKEGGMAPVWEMTDKLWFTDAYTDAANADYHAIRDVFVKTPVPGYLGGTSAVADLAYLPDLPRDHGTDADNRGGRRSGDADRPLGRNPRRHPRRKTHCHRRTAALLECGSARRI